MNPTNSSKKTDMGRLASFVRNLKINEGR